MNSRKAAFIVAPAFWTLYGLLTGFQVWISMITHGHSIPRLVGYYVLVWEAWVGFTALIFWLTRRWPIIPLRRTNILVHVLAAVIIGVSHSLYWISLSIVVRPFDRMTPEFNWFDILSFPVARFPVEFILYCGAVGAIQGVDLYNRYRERELRTAQLEVSLMNAQLQALELQIQPHFLFNTLNAISSLVRANKQSEAVAMIAGLSDLLRYTLEHAGNQNVSLDEETGMLQRYLEIQRVRFPDRLTYGIDIAADVRRAVVPTLILQPLAENAIRHGVAQCAGPGAVTVRAFRDKEQLRIEMFNTGVLHEGREGIGLRNTRERLRQLYGEAQRFELRDLGNGVMASLSIPCREIA